MFVPFGVRRGAAKEAMVSAGILLGAVTADAWTDRWGGDLAEQFGVSPDTARFAVAVGILAAGTLVLGYGGGAALGRLRPGILARAAGAVLAALNGAFLLAYVLAFIQRYLRDGQDPGVVDDGVVGRLLLREFDWLLVGAGGVVALCVVFGLIITAFRRRNEPFQPSGTDLPGGVSPRQRPVRVAREADAGKYEPSPAPSPTPEPRPGRFGGGSGSLGQTTPILDAPNPWRANAEREPGGSWPRPRATREPSQAANGDAPRPRFADDWLRHGVEPGRPREAGGGSGEGATGSRNTEASEHSLRGSGDRLRRQGADLGHDVEPSNSALPAAGQRRCPTCGATIGQQDVFCAECGTTL